MADHIFLQMPFWHYEYVLAQSHSMLDQIGIIYLEILKLKTKIVYIVLAITMREFEREINAIRHEIIFHTHSRLRMR